MNIILKRHMFLILQGVLEAASRLQGIRKLMVYLRGTLFIFSEKNRKKKKKSFKMSNVIM